MNEVFIEFSFNFIDNKDIIEEPFGNDITEESAIFELPSPCDSLSLIFQPPLPLVTDQKVFLDRPPAKVYSGFNIVYVYFTITHNHLPVPNS